MNLDGSVPDDNPVPGQLMYSKGHRNVQGFVRRPNGNIWSSEHGNVIEEEAKLRGNDFVGVGLIDFDSIRFQLFHAEAFHAHTVGRSTHEASPRERVTS